MRKCVNISPYMRRPLVILYMTLQLCSILNFLIYEENFIFFLISVLIFVCLGDQGKSHKPAYVVLVGTHADVAPARKNSNGEFTSPTQGILKEKVIYCPQPGCHFTNISLGGNYDVIYKLFLPRESLVSDIPAGDANIEKLFLRCTVRHVSG
jgi:hypothetical protein